MCSLCNASGYRLTLITAVVQNLTVTCITYYRSDQKNDVIEEKIRAERRKVKIKEVEEEYEKEEKEKMALEMYEKWLVC